MSDIQHTKIIAVAEGKTSLHPRIELLPAVKELDARIRGRLIYQVLRRLEQHPDDGAFVFAGWIVSYMNSGDSIVVGMQEYFR